MIVLLFNFFSLDEFVKMMFLLLSLNILYLFVNFKEGSIINLIGLSPFIFLVVKKGSSFMIVFTPTKTPSLIDLKQCK